MSDARLINEDLRPTRDDERTWSRWHIAALWVGMAVCIPTYTLASGMVQEGWSWKAAVCAVALGNLVVLFPMLLNAHAGTRYGIPFPVLLRSSFGVFGANIPALMRALVACGWFGIQTWIGGSALYYLTLSLFPNAPSLPEILPVWMGIGTGEFAAFLVFWLINVAIIIRGVDSIRVLETWAAPCLLAMGAILFGWAWSHMGDLSSLLAEQKPATRSWESALLGAGITGGVAFWGTLALNIPDFARYAKNQKEQVIGQTIGLVPTMTAFAFVGAVVTNATVFIFGTRIADPVELVSQIGGPVMTVVSMLALAMATLTTNLAANVVSPANDFSNVAPHKISFKGGALIATVIGILIMPWKLYNDAAQYLFTWLIGYGALLGAVAGVMIADY
ncbi:MAG: NCS1 family nucleobase:cation symporter-1, partial [Deltaproteobacteria bacterium]|nr:NCS1 family nucleobase:cation symporter-1 [Deltaproteobacteria bacterium]